MLDFGREDWEPRPHRRGGGAALLFAAALGSLVALLAGCAAPAPLPPSAAASVEPGFSAFCAAHPHHGTCP